MTCALFVDDSSWVVDLVLARAEPRLERLSSSRAATMLKPDFSNTAARSYIKYQPGLAASAGLIIDSSLESRLDYSK
jgi:hypothetical protein